MQLSLLQSRLIASLAASVVIVVIYLFLFGPNFAQAAELQVESVILLDEPLSHGGDVDLDVSYEPDFALFDRSILGRAPAGVRALSNNAPMAMNLDPGKTECFMVEKSALFGTDGGGTSNQGSRRRDEDEHDELFPRADTWKTIYLSANTCLQPDVAQNDSTTTPPQLTVFISNSSDITCPDGSADQSTILSRTFDEGAVMYKINATGDTYIGVSAPNMTEGYTGTFHFEIAASFQTYYHRYEGNGSSQLLWMDSDSSSALLVSKNLTQDYDRIQQIMSAGPPYEIFVQSAESPSINGLRHSVCGLENRAQIWANKAGNGKMNNLVQTGMTLRGPGKLPKQQFYFMGLNASTNYSGILVQTSSSGNSTRRRDGVVGGGGIVFRATDFQTLSGTNCKVVTDLEFCDEIQYAVPGNDKLNNTELAKVYDDYAREMYSNFEKVLMQIPCEAPPESFYSLARNCENCKDAYKRWLCTVSIPRCEDIMGNSSYGIARNLGQQFPNGTEIGNDLKVSFGGKPWYYSSRNPFIDDKIQPGPYKEILPCDDVCYEVVQSCPAAMGFRCPQPRMHSYAGSYARRNPDVTDVVTCNYPGEPRTQTSAASLIGPTKLLGVVLLIVCLLV